jgi:hypothetical protein
MFLRRDRKEAGGEDFEYWSFVKTMRTARGPRHQIVAHLGKLDAAAVQAARGGEDVDALLEGSTASRQLSLTPEPASEPLWKEIDVRGVKVERLRQFGRVYLGLALWRRLGLHRPAARLMPPGQEGPGLAKLDRSGESAIMCLRGIDGFEAREIWRVGCGCVPSF